MFWRNEKPKAKREKKRLLDDLHGVGRCIGPTLSGNAHRTGLVHSKPHRTRPYRSGKPGYRELCIWSRRMRRQTLLNHKLVSRSFFSSFSSSSTSKPPSCSSSSASSVNITLENTDMLFVSCKVLIWKTLLRYRLLHQNCQFKRSFKVILVYLKWLFPPNHLKNDQFF